MAVTEIDADLATSRLDVTVQHALQLDAAAVMPALDVTVTKVVIDLDDPTVV